MQIRQVDRSDAGKYKISSRNSAGEGHISFRLKVKGTYSNIHMYNIHIMSHTCTCTPNLLILSLSLSLSLSPSLDLPVSTATHGYEQSESDEDNDPSEW